MGDWRANVILMSVTSGRTFFKFPPFERFGLDPYESFQAKLGMAMEFACSRKELGTGFASDVAVNEEHS